MRISIACDHAGYTYKEAIKDYLIGADYSVEDFGTHSEESVDYPDFVHPVANSIASNESVLGILICGSGNGVTITANKHKEIRAALCWNQKIASLARSHNNANIICIPSRFVSLRLAKMMVKTFVNTEFEGGRHQRRVDKISRC